MGVSIDDDSPDGLDGSDEAARAVLTSWLDDFAAGRCEREDLEEAFISVCSADAEAPWEALALLDQYQRLGRVNVELARELKAKIAQLAVGATRGVGKRANKGVTPRTRSASSSSRNAFSRSPARGLSDAENASTPASGQQIGPDSAEAHTDDIDLTALRTSSFERAALTDDDSNAIEFDSDEDDEEDDSDADDSENAVDAAVTRAPATAGEESSGEVIPPRPSRVARDPSARRMEPVLIHSRPDSSESGVRSDSSQVARAARSAKRLEPRLAARVEPRLRPLVRDEPVLRVLRGRYELLSVLARGNTSTVYKALDRHRANLVEEARYVAIKVLDASIDARPDTKAQLEREFHQAQSLSHPNIASVFDLDRDGGTYFIVMELLEGDLLATILRRLDSQPMQRKHALSLIASIGAALSYAHRREVVHGDLKPPNVMVTSAGEVRVLEFGFARAGALQAGELDAGRDVVSISAPAYASAERVHGFEPEAGDDVYSLACIAYELLSGRHPYGGRSGLLARANGKRPARIPGLSHRQWQALQRALVWDRADRQIDVAELLTALEATDAVAQSVPPELLSIPEDVGARRRRMLGMAALVVVAVGIAVYLVTRIPPPVQSVDRATISAPASSESVTASEQTPMPSEEVVAPTLAPSTAPSVATRTPGITASPSASGQGQAASAEARSRGASGRAAASAQPATVQFSRDSFVVMESQPAVAIEVVRAGSLRGDVTFRWSARSNSAEAGSDFAAIGPGVEQIPAGARSATVLIPLINDSVVENTELFLVDLQVITEGVSLGEIAHAAVIIVDDD